MKKLILYIFVVASLTIIGCTQNTEGAEPKSAELAPGKTLEFTEGSEGTGGGSSPAAAPKKETMNAEPLPDEGH